MEQLTPTTRELIICKIKELTEELSSAHKKIREKFKSEDSAQFDEFHLCEDELKRRALKFWEKTLIDNFLTEE